MKNLDDLTDLPQNDNNITVFVHPNGFSTETNAAFSVMELLELDMDDWELQNKITFAISPWVQYEREHR